EADAVAALGGPMVHARGETAEETCGQIGPDQRVEQVQRPCPAAGEAAGRPHRMIVEFLSNFENAFPGFGADAPVAVQREGRGGNRDAGCLCDLANRAHGQLTTTFEPVRRRDANSRTGLSLSHSFCAPAKYSFRPAPTRRDRPPSGTRS